MTALAKKIVGGLGMAGLLTAGVWAFRSDAAGAARVDPAAVDLSALDSVPRETWAALGEKRILFGRQSVGADIIAGLRDIMTARPEISLRIVESRDPSAFDEPGLVHFAVGTNEDAAAKMKDFAEVVRGPLGRRADIVMMKFCYVDLFGHGDPEALFGAYRSTVESLGDERIVHMTIPLTTVETGLKARVKAVIGKPLWGHSDNAARYTFNQNLRTAYPGAVFDLARSESTLPDGRRAAFAWGGLRVECLTTGYTDDGGHLNAAGRRAAARDLLLMLAARCK